MKKQGALIINFTAIFVIVGAALMFLNIKAGLALYDAPEWYGPKLGDTFVANADGTVTVNFAVYSNNPGSINQSRMFLQVIDSASSTEVALDNGGYGSWVDSVPSNIPSDFGTSTLAVKLSPVREYRFSAWIVDNNGVAISAPTPERGPFVPGSGFPPQTARPDVLDENIFISTSSNMVNAKNKISFKFLEAWSGVNGYIIDRKIYGQPGWTLGTTFYTYDDNVITSGHSNQALFPDSECQLGRSCFALDDPDPVEPDLSYQYRIRLAYRASPSDPVIAPQDGGKATTTSASLVDIPTFDAVDLVSTSTHASSSMSLYFHAPAPLDSYSNDGSPGFDTYQVKRIVDGTAMAPEPHAISEYDSLSSPFYVCSNLFQCYGINDIVQPGVKYQYLVRPCVKDNGVTRCAESWATSTELTAPNYLEIPKATDIGVEAPTSTPVDSMIALHFRSDVALTALPVTHYQIQVIEDGVPRAASTTIVSTANNKPGDSFFSGAPGACVGDNRCFKLPNFSSSTSSPVFKIIPGRQYAFRVRLAYLGTSPYNYNYSEWIETSPAVTAAELVSITLSPPASVKAHVRGSNMISLELNYNFDSNFLDLVKTIPGYSSLTGYEINKFPSVNQVQYRTTATTTWSPYMSGANYVQAASGIYINNANQTIGDNANEISPTTTPLLYINPNYSYYFQAKSINKYIVGQDSAYTQSNLIDLRPLPEANNVQVSRYDLTNYSIGFSYDFSNSGPTAFYVQWNTVEDPADAGWNTTNQTYVECTTNTFPCLTNAYGLDPTQEWYFRVIPVGQLDNNWKGYVKADSGTISNIASPILFSTSSNHSLSQININFNQPNDWNGFNRYEIREQVGTWSGSDWTWSDSGWSNSGTSTQNTSLDNAVIENYGAPFDSNTCNPNTRCYKVSHNNGMANPIVPGRAYRYLVRLCVNNGGYCSLSPAWVTSTPVTAPDLVPVLAPEIPTLTGTSTYVKSKITVFFKYTGGWDGLSRYSVEKQANGGAWLEVGNYAYNANTTIVPAGCGTANTCYSLTYDVTPSSTNAFRIKVYSSSPATSSPWATSANLVSPTLKPSMIVSDGTLVAKNCFNEGCGEAYFRLSPTVNSWMTTYAGQGTWRPAPNGPTASFAVYYKLSAESVWSPYGSSFNPISNNSYDGLNSAVLKAINASYCGAAKECFRVQLNSLLPSSQYDFKVIVTVGGFDGSWVYIPLQSAVEYPLGQITTNAATTGAINPPAYVTPSSTDIGSNLIKLNLGYDYQPTLPALYRSIYVKGSQVYSGLPEGYQVTDKYWSHYNYDIWSYQNITTSQIQYSNDGSSWIDSGMSIADSGYITASNTALGDNIGEINYPNANYNNYYYIDRSKNWYFRANTINQYLTVAPPKKFYDANTATKVLYWNTAWGYPMSIASTTYTSSGKVTSFKDFPSMLILEMDYNSNQWDADLTIRYDYTKSGPTLYEIQQSDNPSPTSGWVSSNPAERVCMSGVCVIHLTGLTTVDGKYQRYIRVRPKGTSVWMYKNDTVLMEPSCSAISFSMPTSTPGLAISASMINDLRQKINVCRGSMGSNVGYYPFHNTNVAGDTDTQIAGQGLNSLLPGTRIRASHVLELRSAIQEMYQSFASSPVNLKYRVADWNAFWNKDIDGSPLPAECQNLAVGSRICIKHFSMIRQLLADLESCYLFGVNYCH